jgi:large subunit ribosomal protein L17
LAKAKALRVYVEPIITKSKDDSTHARRTAFSYLKSKEAVTELFRNIAPKIADRPGGYCRIIRTGYRLGDNAEMCMIELVDFNEVYTAGDAKKATTRRSRRGGSTTKKAETTETVDAVAEVVEETPVVEAAEETPAVDETPADEAPSTEEEKKDEE